MAFNQFLREELADIIRENIPDEAPRTLNQVLADAFALNPPDREVLEKFLSAKRRVDLDLDPDSVRSTSDENLRALWGLQ